MSKIYGAKVPITPELFEEVLGINGRIQYVSFDPVSRRLDLYFIGDEEHFPLVNEGEYSPTCGVEISTSWNGVTKRVDKTVLIDWDTGKRYVHKDIEKESVREGSEKNRNKITNWR